MEINKTTESVDQPRPIDLALVEQKPTQLVGGRKPVSPRTLSLRERRTGKDRRRTFGWMPRGLVFGAQARREIPGRRTDDAVSVDRYPWRLRGLVIGLLILSVLDALLSIEILRRGGTELNPFVAVLLVNQSDAAPFMLVKQMLTSLGLILLVLHYHARWFRIIRVSTLLVAAVVGYAVLVGYEIFLLSQMHPPLIMI